MNLIQVIAVLLIIIGFAVSMCLAFSMDATNRKKRMTISFLITLAQVIISHLASYFSN
jgi:uncharacterized membrane protein YkgB